MNLNITTGTTIIVVRTATRTVIIAISRVSKYCVDLNNEYNNIYRIGRHCLLLRLDII